MIHANPDIRRKLAKLGALDDDAVDLAEGALLLATAERPGLNLDIYRRHLARLVDDVAAYIRKPQADDHPLDLYVEALRQVLVKRYGYQGTEDIYDDPDGANLTRVIDRRNGLPVALGILFLHVGRSLGWQMEGLDFPGRFLIRLEVDGERIILDPFDGCITMEAHDLRTLLKAVSGMHAELTPDRLAVMSNRRILLRLVENIKARLLRAERLEGALEVVEIMLLFAPQAHMLWREAGLLHARLDHLAEAVAALEEFLRVNTDDSASYRTSVLLQELRGRLN